MAEPEPASMRHGCWKSASVMRGYVKELLGATTPLHGKGFGTVFPETEWLARQERPGRGSAAGEA